MLQSHFRNLKILDSFIDFFNYSVWFVLHVRNCHMCVQKTYSCTFKRERGMLNIFILKFIFTHFFIHLFCLLSCLFLPFTLMVIYISMFIILHIIYYTNLENKNNIISFQLIIQFLAKQRKIYYYSIKIINWLRYMLFNIWLKEKYFYIFRLRIIKFEKIVKKIKTFQIFLIKIRNKKN